MTSTFTLRGRRGTYGTEVALVARWGSLLGAAVAGAVGVAGVAIGDIHLHFAWQACHLWHWTGSGGALGSPFGPAVAAAVGVAGVALGDIHLHFVWQAWHLVTSTFTLHGRRGTWRQGPPLCGRRGTW